MLAGMEEVGTGLLDRLDAMQRVAASAPGGPLLIVAGPGTGKNLHLQAGAFQGDPGLRYHLGDDVALISLAHAESPCLNIA
jgi:hypothetical protein